VRSRTKLSKRLSDEIHYPGEQLQSASSASASIQMFIQLLRRLPSAGSVFRAVRHYGDAQTHRVHSGEPVSFQLGTEVAAHSPVCSDSPGIGRSLGRFRIRRSCSLTGRPK
jgi:hypothetical protein